MVATIETVAFEGIEACRVEVQVMMSNGLPSFTIVGLPDKAVSEARERVRAALSAIGLSLPPKRITVSLSPANRPKAGSHYDLPIAVAVLVAMGVIASDALEGVVVMGELGLDASIRSVAGVLPAAMYANACDMGFVCPAETGSEASWAGGNGVLAPASLLALMNHLKGVQVLSAPSAKPLLAQGSGYVDFADIKGQETAKRALEVAAAGGHTMLMMGPPGSGKSMLASAMPSILPPLTPEEALEVSMVASVAGTLENGAITRGRPFRSPHHSASQPALIGGGAYANPGEVSLAHNGVLFLDEMPEFSRSALEALRQPLETGTAVIARAQAHVTYPARFQLLAAMNPCRCGYLADAARACSRAPLCGADYQAKISGPLYDRIDLFVDVPALTAAELSAPAIGEPSSVVAARVAAARERQTQRFVEQRDAQKVKINAQMSGKLLEKVLQLDGSAHALMEKAAETYQLSARGYHRVLKVARTIADLAVSETVSTPHIAEALNYRRIDARTSLRRTG
ncbi:YifB family Mg chelatase-like AAA ATPase [Kordiimonas aquimaris]|uniref:YifB family Mg chelatase-like AAA ATPase n=1 Tax=Kordiimonas aquimaris TaxID=707591 RepID=UPI0021D06004|nr:YifB family Mg chelatase-like AAA ATPase [Kordiimonas aquimaris]